MLISHSTLTTGYNSKPVLKVCYSQYCIILVQKQKQNQNKLYFPSSSYQTIKQTIKYFFPHKLRLASLSTKLTTIYISYALYMYHKKKKNQNFTKKEN